MDSIVEAFVEAGYFRARISSLSDFDKIIGGLAWAMQVFSYDINIDIFYTDNLDLGQKIALTERLVMVILVMNCPHQIEPHQIVGLDYANILPVVRWLIKRSTEVRREHEAFNRLLALRHFHRVTNSSMDRSRWCHIVPVEHLIRIDEKSATVAHGLDSTTGNVQPLDSHNNQKDQAETNKLALEATSLLLDRLSERFKDNQQVSFVKLPSLFRIANRDQGSSEFGKLDEDEDENSDDSGEGSSAKRGAIGRKELVASESISPLATTMTTTTTTSLANEETGGKVQAAEQDFSDELGGRSAQDSLELHKELDTELLATNQKILNLVRKLDSMPSNLEIEQYQRRYIELHQQLISKNKDVKKLYTLFNSLDSTKHYLTKEINLLDSISANLDLTTNSAVNRDQFLKQFQDIIAKIQSVRDDVVVKLNSTRKKCDSLNAEYASLLSS